MNLQITDIEKIYPNGFHALKGISLTINTGEMVALLGASGSGKTTLLRIIAGLESATRGTVSADTVNITTLPPQQREFGFVFQDYALFPHMNVAENIGFGLKMRGVKKSKITATVTNMLHMVHIPDLANRYPSQLSGGQKQRVAMARALAIQPKLLLLDEPFSALDTQVRESLRQATLKLQKKVGIAGILVTHDQDEALNMADKIAIMHNGTIEQFDTPQNIIKAPATEYVKNFIRVSPDFYAGGGI